MPETSSRRQYPTCAASVAQVRAQVREFLQEWGISEEVSEDAQHVILVASELATNAVRHTRGIFTLSVEFNGDIIHVSVRDTSERPPAKLFAGDEAENGRGLFLVNALSSSWGWRTAIVGKTTWAELTIKVPECTE